MSKGLKFDTDKVDLSLLPTEALEEVARVLMFGAQKYGPYNWEKGIEYTRLGSGAYRHLNQFLDKREDLDIDPTCPACLNETCTTHSRRHHIAAAICNLLFLLSFEMNGRKSLDNRRVKIK